VTMFDAMIAVLSSRDRMKFTRMCHSLGRWAKTPKSRVQAMVTLHQWGKALKHCVRQGNLRLVRETLRCLTCHGVRVDEVILGDVMHLAVCCRRFTVVSMLLEHGGTDACSATRAGRLIQISLAMGGFTQELQDMIAKEQDADTDPSICDEHHRVLLEKSAGAGHLEIVRWLIDRSPEHCCNVRKALESASASGHVECVRVLLPFVRDAADLGYALCQASKRGDEQVVCLLLSNLTRPHVVERQLRGDALGIAEEFGHVGVIQLLVQAAGCSARARVPIEAPLSPL
jgi:hypothetical protein